MITGAYKDVLTRSHDNNKKWGAAGYLWGAKVLGLIKATKAKTILDFGAGKGELKAFLGNRRGIEVTEYDPGIPGKDVLPDKSFDIIVSTEVLEHVEPEFLEDTVRWIKDRAKKGIFITVPHKAASRRSTLVDGRNAHLTVENQEWWVTLLRRYWPEATYESNVWAVANFQKVPMQTEFTWKCP